MGFQLDTTITAIEIWISRYGRQTDFERGTGNNRYQPQYDKKGKLVKQKDKYHLDLLDGAKYYWALVAELKEAVRNPNEETMAGANKCL